MYAIKPWGKVVLVGSNVGTYAMGIGMRWRESIVRLVERRPDPRYELENHRRCVLTAQTMKLLKDLGCTTAKVENILRRARGWRFVRPDLEVVRESSTFPGCAEGEPAYHCSEGMLLRMLRSEFIRFGGNISWGTEAYDAFESGDGTGLWSLRKMYGMESEAEAIITTAKDSPLASLLIADDPNRIAVLFDEETGISPAEGTLTGKIFGSADVVLLVGEELVLHLWNIGDTVAWRAIRRGRKENPDLQTLALHPAIHEMVARSVQRTTRMRVLPATTPAVKDTSSHMRVSILGDALLPIDPFEWRGDRARCNIEEASALCRAFYGKKFHRGNVPHILREVEQDSLAKRAAVLRRDLMDAEHFLCGKFAIEEDFSTSGTLVSNMLRRTILYCDELKKVLVANRGEIACRIFRTCREMNIRTVAVCCESETRAKHVLEADEALILGPSPASTSYLRGDRIIDGCRKLQADAVHPGYGFLSENPEFASAVVASGIKFIGPPPQAMVLMGSKSESKRIMEAAGVPVVPGYYGSDQSLVRLWEEVKKIGFPVLIKAVSGGGGKGMKIVTEESDFELMLNSAKREAQNYFKDDRVLLERYITQPRHIECQIFFDTFGNGVFFFERDCSVQRRYQKVVEEAPAPFLSEEMRGHIGAVALRAAKAVGYVGAGTVEFIFDTEKDEFFFMEMNTRLQVEHPVTEEVCRIKGKPLDLVCLQLQVAAGLPLGFTQEDISMCGVCLETRIYAESPANGFLPMSGKLCYIKEPQQGAQNGVKVRLDTGFRSGDNVLVHYDPMIAKLIVWGDDRRTALEGMRIALRSYHILGVETNIDFLQRCLDNHSFIRGGVTTRFIEDNKAMLLTAKRTSNDMVALGAVALLCRFSRSRNAFWPNRHRSQSVSFVLHGALVAVSVASFADGRFDCEVNGAHFSIVVTDVKMSDDMSLRLGVQLDGEHQFYLTSRVTDSQVALDTPMGFFILPLQPLTRDFGNVTARTGGSARVTSPTPGKVTKFFVVSGTEVKRGQPILILEAMKMEQVIKATSDGKVEFYVQEGNIVGGNHLLAEIVPQDA